MRTLFALAVLVIAAPAAWAGGGIEIDEHSAPGVGMAGAQTAIADDPAAIYYNPAGIGFQPGFGVLAGGDLIIARTHVSPDNLTLWHPAFEPTKICAVGLSVGWSMSVPYGTRIYAPPCAVQ